MKAVSLPSRVPELTVRNYGSPVIMAADMMVFALSDCENSKSGGTAVNE
jgi:hypothetical protein